MVCFFLLKRKGMDYQGVGMKYSKRSQEFTRKYQLFLFLMCNSILVRYNINIRMKKDISIEEDSIFESSNECPLSVSQESETLIKKQKNNQKRKEARRRKLQMEKAKFREAFWSLEENLKYIAFLKVNRELFSLSVADRKKVKINIKLSEWVGTRSADQARSHHQKMLQYHKNFEGIIAHVENEERLSKSKNQIQIQKQLIPIIEEQEQVVFNTIQAEEGQDSLEKDLWDVLDFDWSSDSSK